MDESKNEIIISGEHIKIIFNLNIYEYNSKIFDDFTYDIKYHEIISADIYFKSLKFYEIYGDFSFDFQYEIDNLENDVIINYENIDKLNSFNYLLFEDKNDLYDNYSLNNFIKIKILNTFIEEIRKYLIYFPECDSLEYFNSIINYLKNQLFSFELRINTNIYLWMSINQCKVSKFNFKEIIKNNRTIIFKNINITAFLEYSLEDPNDFDKEQILNEIKTLQIDYISIDNNKRISYGNVKYDEEYALETLKLVINKTIDALDYKEN